MVLTGVLFGVATPAAADPAARPSASQPAPTPIPDPASPSTTAPSSAPGSSAPAGATAPSLAAPSRKAPQRAAADCGGPIALGSIISCPGITTDEIHRYTVTTNTDGERLALTLHTYEIEVGADLIGPDGVLSCSFSRQSKVCDAPAAGTYTITVDFEYGDGAAPYHLGADSRDSPAVCPQLDPATFAFPPHPHDGTLPAGAAFRCYTIDQPSGTRMQLTISERSGDVRGTLENAAGESVCRLPDAHTCTLDGPGPYRALLTEAYGDAADYQFTVTQLSDPVGCTDIPLAGFGPAATRSAPGEVVRHGESTCHTFKASAGMHYVKFAGDSQYVNWQLVDYKGAHICHSWHHYGVRCRLPTTDRYRIHAHSNDHFGDHGHAFTVAVHPLGADEGCAGGVSTRWDGSATRGEAQPLQVDCRPLDAAPGERVLLDHHDDDRVWITDATGGDICEAEEDSYQDGCVLPGAGPYRIIAAPRVNPDEASRAYTLTARRLSNPQGCETVTPGQFGAPAAGAATTNRCRLLAIPAAGSYTVEAALEDDNRAHGSVYDAAGRKVCRYLPYCAVEAAGTYTLVVDDDRPSATVLLSGTGTEGCVPVPDRPVGALHTMRFDSPGQYRCVLLPTPADASVTFIEPQDTPGRPPAMTVVDADGDHVCDDSVLRQSCTLKGRAPFRVLS
ncbi:MAG TPA: hypothetical protein VF657_26535, partial [Actinoplanes sp.]